MSKPTYVITSPPTFRSGKFITSFLTVSAVILLLIYVVMAGILSFYQYSGGPPPEVARSFQELSHGLIHIYTSLFELYYATGLAIWCYLHINTFFYFNRKDTKFKYSPLSTVFFAFFIPIYTLFAPVLLLRHIWRATFAPIGDDNWTQYATPSFIIKGWVFFYLSFVFLGFGIASKSTALLLFFLILAFLSLAAGFYFINKTITLIHKKQIEMIAQCSPGY